MNTEFISMDALEDRIQSTDLVPSRVPLLEGIQEKFFILEQQGVHTLGELRRVLKTNPRLEETARSSGIDSQYLILLRREIEGYFPKPLALMEFDELNPVMLEKLTRSEIRDTAGLFSATRSPESLVALSESCGVEVGTLTTLAKLADLSRVQWVSLPVARLLLACGVDNPATLVTTDAEDLFEAFNQVNLEAQFFKGKIGLRDVKRLIHAAKFVED